MHSTIAVLKNQHFAHQEQTLQKWQSVTRKALFITFKGKITVS